MVWRVVAWVRRLEVVKGVKGVVRKAGSALGTDEDEGYLAQCQKQACTVM